MITKAKKEAFNEIFDTIASRNPDMLVGYNRDTCDRANVLIKKIKQKKKNSKQAVKKYMYFFIALLL